MQLNATDDHYDYGFGSFITISPLEFLQKGTFRHCSKFQVFNLKRTVCLSFGKKDIYFESVLEFAQTNRWGANHNVDTRWPSASQCASCRDANGDMIESEVLKYMENTASQGDLAFDKF